MSCVVSFMNIDFSRYCGIFDGWWCVLICWFSWFVDRIIVLFMMILIRLSIVVSMRICMVIELCLGCMNCGNSVSMNSVIFGFSRFVVSFW